MSNSSQPDPPSLDDFLTRPDGAGAASFVLGAVTLLSLRLALVAADAPRALRAYALPRLAHSLREPEPRQEQDLGNLEAGVGKAVGGDELTEEAQAAKERAENGVTSWLRALETAAEETSMIRDDPLSLSLILTIVIFVHALGGFATLLAFSPGASVGESVASSWAAK